MYFKTRLLFLYRYIYSYSADGLCNHAVLLMSISHHPFINPVLKYEDVVNASSIEATPEMRKPPEPTPPTKSAYSGEQLPV